MEVITIYKSIDGHEFDYESECLEYEMKLLLTNTKLRVYKGNRRLTDLLSDDTYNYCTKVVVPDRDALYDLNMIKDYNGYYDGIDSVGTWKYNDENHSWERAGE